MAETFRIDNTHRGNVPRYAFMFEPCEFEDSNGTDAEVAVIDSAHIHGILDRWVGAREAENEQLMISAATEMAEMLESLLDQVIAD